MKYLLYYNVNSQFVSDQTAHGGDGTNVVSVVDGVAWTNDNEKTYYRHSGDATAITSYTVTIHYVSYDDVLGRNTAIRADDIYTVNVYRGKSTTEKILPRVIEGYEPQEAYKMVDVNSNTQVTFLYDFKYMPHNMFRVYYKKTGSSAQNFINKSNNKVRTIFSKYVTSGLVDDETVVDNFSSYYEHIFTGTTNSIHKIDFYFSGIENSRGEHIVPYSAFCDCVSVVNAKFPKKLGACQVASVTGDQGINSQINLSRFPCSVFRGCTGLTGVTLPKEILKIGSGAFYECSSLVSVEIPDGVKGLEGDCFRLCTSLTGIVIPDSVVYGEADGYNNSMTYFQFLGDTALTTVVLPKSISQLGVGLFLDCSSLKTVVMPESLEKIGERTFAGCSSLEEIEIPKSVNEIDGGAFCGCTSLTSVRIPDNTFLINDSAFTLCTSLQDVFIGTGLKKIGGKVFSGCTALKTIAIAAQECPSKIYSWTNFPFEGVPTGGTLFVPWDKDSRDSYMTKWMGENTGQLGLYYWNMSFTYLTMYYITTAQNETVKILGGYQTSGITTIKIDLTDTVPISYSSTGFSYTFATPGVHRIDVTKLKVDLCKGSPAGGVTCWRKVNWFVGLENLVRVDLLPAGIYFLRDWNGDYTYGYEATFFMGIFDGCSKLSALTVQEETECIGDPTYLNQTPFIQNGICKKYNNIYYLTDKIALTAVTRQDSVYVLKPGTVSVGYECFAGCQNMKEMIFPETVTYINGRSFQYCNSLTDIRICGRPRRIGSEVYNIGGGNTYNGYTFAGTSLTGMTLEQGAASYAPEVLPQNNFPNISGSKVRYPASKSAETEKWISGNLGSNWSKELFI